MSRRRAHSRNKQLLKAVGACLAAAAIIGLLIYLAIAGKTDSWPAVATCTVEGSRVVRDVVGSNRRPLILYHGEYHIGYKVNGQQYYTWATAGWMDSEEAYVMDKVRDLDIPCPVRVQYNPRNPAECITHLLRK
jgi:hypothetical protein